MLDMINQEELAVLLRRWEQGERWTARKDVTLKEKLKYEKQIKELYDRIVEIYEYKQGVKTKMTIEKMQNLVGRLVKLKNKNTGEIWDERKIKNFEVTKSEVFCVLDGKFELIVNVKNFDFWVV
jgi:hypothetical protein